MKPVMVIGLAVLTAAAGTAVWYGNKPAAPELADTTKKLFPALADNPDSIDRLSLRDASDLTVTIERKDGEWTVKEKSRYYANPRKVGELIIAASEAVKVEPKTANPELYPRLGLSDISSPDSAARLLSLEGAGHSFQVLLGNDSSRFGGSTFVRKPDSQVSYLVSPALKGSTDASNWLDTQVFDIASDEIQSVRVTAAAGDVVEIQKTAMFDSSFDLVGREEGRLLNDTAVRSLARGLQGLAFDDVMKGVAFAVNDYKRLTVTYTLFNGIVIDITLFYKDEADEDAAPDSGPPSGAQYWMNAGARFDEALAQRFVPQPHSADDTTNDSSGNSEPGSSPKTPGDQDRIVLTAADLTDGREQVERINQTRKHWIYKISAARFNNMNQSVSTLLTAQD